MPHPFHNSGWIWTDDWNDTDAVNTRLVHFRKPFVIDKNVEKSEIKVSADSRYRLYINGYSVSFGPCKGDRFVWHYDDVDITQYLVQGENVIAAVVLRYPANKNVGNQSVWSTDTPGLYISGSITFSDGTSLPLNADSSWKARKCGDIDFLPEGGLNFLWIQEKARGDVCLSGWNDIGYNETGWLAAKPYQNMQIKTNISPGSISKRPIPMMYEQRRGFNKAFCERNTTISKADWDAMLHGDMHLTIPANSHHVIEIDAGELTTGFLELSLACGRSSKIKILTAESYTYPPKEQNKPFPMPVKGDREDCVNGQLTGMTDEYRVGGYGTADKPEYYEPFWFRTYRFISLDITTANEELTLVSFTYRETGYPLEVKTRVECSDEEMQKIWDISLRTLRRCMHETYEDCPYYEQLQYAMDTRSQILYTYAVSADDRLARKCIDEFHRSLRPEGLINCCYPFKASDNVIPGFSLYYILIIYDHMMYFADKPFIKRYMPTIDAILGFFDSHLTAEGLVDKIGGPLGEKYWSFVDWTKEWDETLGCPTAIKTGSLTVESLLYAYTLRAAASLAEFIGRTNIALEYNERSSKVIEAVNKLCIGENGLYQDGPGVDEYSQHSQVWAVLAGAAQGDVAKNIMINALEDKTLAQCSVAMAFYLFRALEKVGLYERTKELWQPWRDMIKQNLTTCVEDPVAGRSDCHAWGALILYELPAVTLGVRPVKPGFYDEEAQINMGYFEWAKGTVVTPKGMIDVSCKAKNT